MKKQLTAVDAEDRAAKWLADGNAADEKGNLVRAEVCWQKAQYWLDKANIMRKWD